MGTKTKCMRFKKCNTIFLKLIRVLQSGRMSYQGVAVSTDGQQHVPSAVGPMARSASSLISVSKAVIEAELWKRDAQLPPMPWKQRVFEDCAQRPLIVGILRDDGVVRVHPPIERVLEETVAKLHQAGHETVQWDASLNAQCIAIMVSMMTIRIQYHLLTCAGCILHC